MNYSIPDAFWEEIKLIIPVKTSRVGRPETDARKCMDAIFWILKTGAQWSSIPRTTAPYTTIHGKFRKWVNAGVFDKIMDKARALYQERNPGWDVWFALDAALVKAPLGGEKTGKNPTDRGKLGSKKSMIVDQKGAPLGIAIGAANTHDSKLVKPTLKSFDGSFKKETLKIMAADRAYDAATVKNDLRKMKFIPLISINQRRSKKKPENVLLDIDGLSSGPMVGLTIFALCEHVGQGVNLRFWRCLNLPVLIGFFLCQEFSYEF
jgi:putative transposase